MFSSVVHQLFLSSHSLCLEMPVLIACHSILLCAPIHLINRFYVTEDQVQLNRAVRFATGLDEIKGFRQGLLPKNGGSKPTLRR